MQACIGNKNPSIIRFTYFMFYLVKVSPIARVTSITKKSENSMD